MGLQRIGLSVLLLGCLLLALCGTTLLLSALYSHQTARFLSDWSFSGEPPQDAAWQVAESAAKRAILFYPVKDAELYNQLGRVYEWKQFQLTAGDQVAEVSRRQALKAYRLATYLRPTWPYTWTDFALAKVRLNEVDAEMAEALRQAFIMGPWRRAGLQRIAEIGLIAWSLPAFEGQEITLEAVKRGLNMDIHSARATWEIVKQKNAEAMVCAMLLEEAAWLERHC